MVTLEACRIVQEAGKRENPIIGLAAATGIATEGGAQPVEMQNTPRQQHVACKDNGPHVPNVLYNKNNMGTLVGGRKPLFFLNKPKPLKAEERSEERKLAKAEEVP